MPAKNVQENEMIRNVVTELLPRGLFRETLSNALREVMEAEVRVLCSAGYGERSEERQNSRNGYRDRDPGDADGHGVAGNPQSPRYPYLGLDALYVKVREGGRTVGKAVLIATAVSETGNREILGVDVNGPTRVRALAEGHRRYLSWHREKVFQGGR